MEDNLVISYKTKYILAIQSNNHILWYLLKGVEKFFTQKTPQGVYSSFVPNGQKLGRNQDVFQQVNGNGVPVGGRGTTSRTPEWALILRNELSEETHLLTKQETLLGRGPPAENRRMRGRRRTSLPCGWKSRILGWWISGQIFSGQSRTQGPSW